MEKIIERAYNLFSQYDVSPPLDICTHCCMLLENESLLASLPVDEIPIDLLMEYNDGAATERTPINEVKHFLPRYMELISNFDFPSHSAEISLKRLSPFDKEEWTTEELQLLADFSLAFFEKCLHSHPMPSGDSIDSILILFWRAEIELRPLLDLWKQDESPTGILHFKELYFEGFKQRNPDKMSNAFADEQLSLLLRNWIDSKEMRLVFKNTIESIILSDNHEIDDFQLMELSVLHSMLEKESL